ncbi:MAG: TonB family protein [Bacteroidales bacterium]|nr:TonB family protein [Bacteroidales bacterium]
MNELISYLLQSGISLTLFYIMYWLFLRNETFFTLNRIYLLAAILISMVIPLFHISFQINKNGSNLILLLDAVTITPEKIGKSTLGIPAIFEIITTVYVVGVVFFFLRFMMQLAQIVIMIRRYGIILIDGLNIVFTGKGIAPFSFFNIIFIGNDLQDQENIAKIISHEKTHIRQNHSLDIILLELLHILQWFNPVVIQYKNTMKNIHEFLADEGVIGDGYDRISYQELLLRQVMGVRVNQLTNNFSQSIIKRRFIMMSKTRSSKLAWLKMVLIAPITIILTIIFTVTFNESTIAQEISSTGKEKQSVQKSTSQEEEVHKVVDKMPEYPGGVKAFQKFLIENIKYPEDAKKNGVTGTVFISFIIEKDGSVSHVKMLRGIGSGCDEEALRVVSMLPNYNPGIKDGKPVRTEFNVPIKFSLEGGEKKIENGIKTNGTIPPPPPPGNDSK